MKFATIERDFFRSLNSIVEPAVRKGLGSPRLAPASLIVLQSVGFKSGVQRRTPLWSIRLGRYRIISTARGGRSFWVKNLRKQPRASYYVGGRLRDTDAVVVAPGAENDAVDSLPPLLRKLAVLFTQYARAGWAFAILMPADSKA